MNYNGNQLHKIQLDGNLLLISGRYMKVSIAMVCFLAVLVSGCASTETVKKSKGEGVSRIYKYGYAPVLEAVLAAAKNKELEVTEKDGSGGRLLFSHGVTMLSWGERIAVFLKPVTANKTEVEVVSKAVLSPLNFPPDWQKILHEQIAVELRAVK